MFATTTGRPSVAILKKPPARFGPAEPDRLQAPHRFSQKPGILAAVPRIRPDGLSGRHRHTKVDTTLNVYTQVLDGAARDAATRVGSELSRIVQIPGGPTALTH
jgi:hypothetical protein